MQQISILLPVLTLTFWTFIIFAIMAPARFYFLRMKHPQTAAHTKNLLFVTSWLILGYMIACTILQYS